MPRITSLELMKLAEYYFDYGYKLAKNGNYKQDQKKAQAQYRKLLKKAS